MRKPESQNFQNPDGQKRSRRGRKRKIDCLREFDPYLEAQERRIKEHMDRVENAKDEGIW